MPPGGSRGQEVTKSRNRERLAWSISRSRATRWPKSGDLDVMPPAGCRRASRARSSHSTWSSPQNMPRSSCGLNDRKLSRSSTSDRPARRASTCAATPSPNQKAAACSTKLPTFSRVTGRDSPPGHSGAPPRPVSRKRAPTSSRYSSMGVSLSHRPDATSASTPQSSPAWPLPGRGRLSAPGASPRSSAKTSSPTGSGTMKPSRSAWPSSLPTKRNRRAASSRRGPSGSGWMSSPRRHIRYLDAEEPPSWTHSGTSRFASRSWSARLAST
mmetsp:Transcript_94712/g.257106  ORF Transcript_94712/g.257106 Transcript_94712/m.257106 type:complete len:270 (-) Transcript_94712:561-1370(-)